MFSVANALKLLKIIAPLAGKAAQGLDKISWEDLSKAGKEGKAFHDDLAKEAGIDLLAKQECAALEEVFKRRLGVQELEGDQAAAFELVMLTLPKLAKAGEHLVEGDLDVSKATDRLLDRLAGADPEFGPRATNAHAVPVASAVFEAAFTRALEQPEALKKLGLAIEKATLARLSNVAAKIDANEDAAERRHREQMAAQAKHMAMTERLLAETAREKGVDPEKLRPLFEHLGREGLTERQMREEADSAIAEILELARRSVPASNDADIAAVIEAARAKLRIFDTRGARDRLDAALREEEETRRRRKTPLLLERVRIEVAERDFAAAKASYAEIAALNPDDEGWAHVEIGDIERRYGRIGAALDAYREALRRAPSGGRLEAGLHDRIGDMLARGGDGAGALAAYRQSLALAERLAADDPGDAQARRDLSVSHTKIGDMLARKGDGAGALAAYRKSLALRERLAADDPGDALARRDLSVSHERIGDILARGRDGAGALAAHRQSLVLRERLAADDPGDAQARRDLSVSHTKIGDMLARSGDGAGALAAYRQGLALAERLAADNPGDALARSDLSVSHTKIGDMLARGGDGAGALAAYRQSLAIDERLAADDPGDAQARRDLSVSHTKIGDMLARGGDGAGALAAYRQSLALAERLAADDPGDAQARRDLSVSHNRIGDMLALGGDGAGALAAYRQSLAIDERLAADDPGDAEARRDLSVSHNKIGDMLARGGDGPGALAAYRQSLALRERLASADPGDAQAQRDLIVSCVKLSEAAPAEAVDWLARALAIAEALQAGGRLAPEDNWMPDDLRRRLAAARGGGA